MKVRIHLKSPDAVGDAIAEAAFSAALRLCPGGDADEVEAVREIAEEKIKKNLERWIEFGEYVTVEFDLERMTASVLSAGS